MKKYSVEEVSISELKKHPKNYREHPEDQLAHLIASIEKNGVYKNIVVSKDGFILAGHGVVKALEKMDIKEVPIIRLDILSTDIEAIKILIGDNEISHLVELNDTELVNMLKEIKDIDVSHLLGTGYDDVMLANLLFITRNVDEVKDLNEAAEWVGMPDFEKGKDTLQLIVNFKTEEDRTGFFNVINQSFSKKTKFIWWPENEREDTSSLKLE